MRSTTTPHVPRGYGALRPDQQDRRGAWYSWGHLLARSGHCLALQAASRSHFTPTLWRDLHCSFSRLEVAAPQLGQDLVPWPSQHGHASVRHENPVNGFQYGGTMGGHYKTAFRSQSFELRNDIPLGRII